MLPSENSTRQVLGQLNKKKRHLHETGKSTPVKRVKTTPTRQNVLRKRRRDDDRGARTPNSESEERNTEERHAARMRFSTDQLMKPCQPQMINLESERQIVPLTILEREVMPLCIASCLHMPGQGALVPYSAVDQTNPVQPEPLLWPDCGYFGPYTADETPAQMQEVRESSNGFTGAVPASWPYYGPYNQMPQHDDTDDGSMIEDEHGMLSLITPGAQAQLRKEEVVEAGSLIGSYIMEVDL